MMILYDKHSGKKETIYGVLDDDHGYPKLLIRKGNQWIYRSAKHYITEEEINFIDNKHINKGEFSMTTTYCDGDVFRYHDEYYTIKIPELEKHSKVCVIAELPETSPYIRKM